MVNSPIVNRPIYRPIYRSYKKNVRESPSTLMNFCFTKDLLTIRSEFIFWLYATFSHILIKQLLNKNTQ